MRDCCTTLLPSEYVGEIKNGWHYIAGIQRNIIMDVYGK